MNQAAFASAPARHLKDFGLECALVALLVGWAIVVVGRPMEYEVRANLELATHEPDAVSGRRATAAPAAASEQLTLHFIDAAKRVTEVRANTRGVSEPFAVAVVNDRRIAVICRAIGANAAKRNCAWVVTNTLANLNALQPAGTTLRRLGPSRLGLSNLLLMAAVTIGLGWGLAWGVLRAAIDNSDWLRERNLARARLEFRERHSSPEWTAVRSNDLPPSRRSTRSRATAPPESLRRTSVPPPPPSRRSTNRALITRPRESVPPPLTGRSRASVPGPPPVAAGEGPRALTGRRKSVALAGPPLAAAEGEPLATPAQRPSVPPGAPAATAEAGPLATPAQRPSVPPGAEAGPLAPATALLNQSMRSGADPVADVTALAPRPAALDRSMRSGADTVADVTAFAPRSAVLDQSPASAAETEPLLVAAEARTAALDLPPPSAAGTSLLAAATEPQTAPIDPPPSAARPDPPVARAELRDVSPPSAAKTEAPANAGERQSVPPNAPLGTFRQSTPPPPPSAVSEPAAAARARQTTSPERPGAAARRSVPPPPPIKTPRQPMASDAAWPNSLAASAALLADAGANANANPSAEAMTEARARQSTPPERLRGTLRRSAPPPPPNPVGAQPLTAAKRTSLIGSPMAPPAAGELTPQQLVAARWASIVGTPKTPNPAVAHQLRVARRATLIGTPTPQPASGEAASQPLTAARRTSLVDAPPLPPAVPAPLALPARTETSPTVMEFMPPMAAEPPPPAWPTQQNRAYGTPPPLPAAGAQPRARPVATATADTLRLETPLASASVEIVPFTAFAESASEAGVAAAAEPIAAATQAPAEPLGERLIITSTLSSLDIRTPAQRHELDEVCFELHELSANGCFIARVSSPPTNKRMKTQVAVQLAWSLAAPGRARVLLVESDFDEPALHEALRLKPPPFEGFSQQLNRRMLGSGGPLPWTVLRCAPGLNALVEGRVRTPGLLDSSAFWSALDEQRVHYDIIIADGPVMNGSDGRCSLDALTDGVVLAVAAAEPLGEHMFDDERLWVLRTMT